MTENPTPKTEPMLSVPNAMLLINTLCNRGWTVQFTSFPDVQVVISSTDQEYKDFQWAGYGKTAEQALLAAALQLYDDLSETARLVRSCLPDEVQP